MNRPPHFAIQLMFAPFILMFLVSSSFLAAQETPPPGNPCGCPDSGPRTFNLNKGAGSVCLYLYPYNMHLVSGARSAVPLQIRDASGAIVGGTMSFFGYDTSLISISNDGYVTAKRPETSTEIGAWVDATIGGQSVANSCIVRVLSTNYNLVYTVAESPNTMLYYPTSVNGENISNYVTQFEMAQATEYAYKVERTLMGTTPFGGCKQIYEIDFGEAEAQRVCGISGNPIRIGWGAGGDVWQNCFLVPFIPPRSPQWGVMYHEMGHNMTMISYTFSEGLGITHYIEGIATAIGVETSSQILDGLTRYPIGSDARNSIAWVLNRDTTGFISTFTTWLKSGAAFSSYNIDLVDGLWLYYRRVRPTDFAQRFFTPLQPQYQDRVSGYFATLDAAGDNGKHTFFAALVSAAVGTDLSSQFTNTYHFPLVQPLFTNLYQTFGSIIAQAASNAGPATAVGLMTGNNQTGTISTALANPLVVRVTNADGYSVSGVSVSFAISTAPTGATGQSLSTATTTTNSSGQASTVLTLGNKVGTYTVTATSSGLSGSPVTFTTSATAGTAKTISQTAGDNQTGPIGTQLANPFLVMVTDAGGNPVQGVSVGFAIASTPTGATGQSLSAAVGTTNGSGTASTILTLGNKAGSYTVSATSSGLSGSPVMFTATGANPVPTLSSVSTNRAGRGSRINQTVGGGNFLPGVTTVSFGADITVNSQVVIRPTQISSNISIGAGASIGARDVTVTNAGPGGGTATLTNGFTVDTSTPMNVEIISGSVPDQFVLRDAYPNPFNPSTTIQFALPKTSFATLKVYNLVGKEVATLVAQELNAGYYATKWLADVPSGIYFYSLQARPTNGGQSADASTDLQSGPQAGGSAEGFLETKKVVLLK